MNHPELLMEEVDKDCTYTDADLKKGYKEGSFIGTIAYHADQVLGICSTFHVSSPDTIKSRPLPGGRNDCQMNRDRERLPCHHRSFRSRSTATTVPTNSLSDHWDDVNMTDADSIRDYCVNCLDHQLPENTDPAMLQFVHAVQSIVKDTNRFDKTKFPCAMCDQLGHTFENCPVLQSTDLKEAYICLLLLVKKFVKGLN